MRSIPLLCAFVFAASLLCCASEEKVVSDDAEAVVPSGRTEYAFAASDINKGAAKLLKRRANLQRRLDNNSCLMLRTFVVVREDRDSDVTRRDGEITCQPAWKFEIRSAVTQGNDR